MITTQWLLRQLKADLIGKDSYRGVTLTYAWLANQFGHFALGFIPTLCLYKYLDYKDAFANNVLMSAILITVVWALFEAYNFLGPLLKGGNRVYTFKPAWANVAFDTSTDVLFFAIGGFTATFLIEYQQINLYTLIGLLSIIVWPTMYWFKTKMYQQAARFPFQYRLSQWKNGISQDDKNKVTSFMSKSSNGKHLLVFGSKKSGKTSLSIAIANEKAIQHKACTYTTAMKLFGMFNDHVPDSNLPWDWKDSEYLIIDDINPGGEIKDELVQVNEFKRFMESNSENTKVLKDKNVIWVLGNYKDDKQGEQWFNLLKDIGVPSEDIQSIDLAEKEVLEDIVVLREAY